ncbi:MAG: HAMP domain-containing sensor histidine kinase [Kofleriaceae bacterium]
MLSDFVSDNRLEIIERCRARVALRVAPRPTEHELEEGIPLFLDQLAATLRSKLDPATATKTTTAATHGESLLRRGFTIGQVVHDYGDVCQTITTMAVERTAPISAEEFRTLNMCLDDAIADAVSEFGRLEKIDIVAEDAKRATQDLGFLAHELRNFLGTATLACEALRNGSVGASGSTSAILERSLKGMRDLVDRSLSLVRLDAGVLSRERILIRELMQEIEISAVMEVKARGHQLTLQNDASSAEVVGDRHILASVVSNLIQNACKFTHSHSHVVLRARATTDQVRIEVEDECGGLAPGVANTIFKPFTQAGADRSGVGLGLAICVRGIDTLGGTIRVQDRPGKGCVFIVELPRAPQP